MGLQEKVTESFDGCRLCLGAYKNPKTLQCLHTFCENCLNEKLEKPNEVICSLCEHCTQLPYQGVSGLLTNNFIIRKQYLKGLQLQVQSNYSTETESDDDPDNSLHTESFINGEEECRQINPPSPTQTGLANYFDFSCSTYKNKEPLATRHLRNTLEDNVMDLRSEILGVTEAMSLINHHVSSWQQRKSEVKTRIQQRSFFLQRAVQDEEKNLLVEIENLPSEKGFLTEVETKKRDLHKFLKSSLHGIAFSRQILCEGTEDEINELAGIINQRLGQRICQEIFLDVPEFHLDLPKKQLEEMVSDMYGDIVQHSCEKKIYSPQNDYKVEKYSDTPVQVFETETILVSASDFSQIKATANNNDILTYKEKHETNGLLGRPDAVVTTESSTDLPEETSTFNRFMSLRVSLREKRNRILRAHSDSSTDAYDRTITNSSSSIAWDAQQVLNKPKPRQRIRRYHTINVRPSYDYNMSRYKHSTEIPEFKLDNTFQDINSTSTHKSKKENNNYGVPENCQQCI